MTTVKVKGIIVPLNGTDYVVPPLSLAAVERFQDRLKEYQGGMQDVSLVIDALTAALQRNYPHLTREVVADMVDLSNMTEVMLAVMSVSKLVPTGENLPREAAENP